VKKIKTPSYLEAAQIAMKDQDRWNSVLAAAEDQMSSAKAIQAAMKDQGHWKAVVAAAKDQIPSTKAIQAAMKDQEHWKAIMAAAKDQIPSTKAIQAAMKDQGHWKATMAAAEDQMSSTKAIQAAMKDQGHWKSILATVQDQISSAKTIQAAIKDQGIFERFIPQGGSSLQSIFEKADIWKEYSTLQHQVKDLQQSAAPNQTSTIEANVSLGLSVSLSMVTGEMAGTHTPVAIGIQEQIDNISHSVSILFDKAESLKNPLITQLIIVLVCGFFFAYFNPIAAHQVENYLNKSEKKQISKQNNKNANSLPIDRSVLNSFRQVDADKLHVRKQPSKSGEILGYLYFGQAVEIVEKKKNWTMVRWTDDNRGITIEGWTFTRYLKMFK